MTEYWIAFSEARGHKYACLFSEFERIQKYLDAIASYQNPLRMRDTAGFHEELRQNFTVKVFENRASAEKFQDTFLNGKNHDKV